MYVPQSRTTFSCCRIYQNQRVPPRTDADALDAIGHTLSIVLRRASSKIYDKAI